MHSLNTGEAKGFYSDYPDTDNLLKFVRYIEKIYFLTKNTKKINLIFESNTCPFYINKVVFF